MLSLVVLVAIYTLLLWGGVARSYHHLHVVLLAFQYLLLLPVVVRCLRSHKDKSSAAHIPAPNLTTIAVLFALLALPLSWFSTRGLLNPDESGYSFEARTFLSGHLKAPPLIGASAEIADTPEEVAFGNHVLRPDGWFPKFPPGWPAVLTLGYAVSMHWIVTPILGILSLVTIVVIGREIFSADAGLLAAFFAALSPFYLVNSIGMMSHALCGLLSAAACYCLFRGLHTGRLSFFAAMFAALGYGLQVRPYTAFVLAVAMTAAALWQARNNSALAVRIFVLGCGIGGIALGCVLLYNRLYTGNALVSPYALAVGASAPPELTLHPGRIWQGIAQYGQQSFEESLIGVFPFTYLLAGYALFTDRERQSEVWILVAIYLSLWVAYLAHPEGSGVFFGERFHFEGIFAVFLLAARGAFLLVQRWNPSPRRAAAVLVALSMIQVSQQAAAAITVARKGEPYRRIRAATSHAPAGIVFLQDGPGFVAKHFNLNQPDWRKAVHVFLVDAEPNLRNEWACRYGASTWTLARYDPKTHAAIVTTQPAQCASSLSPR